MTDHKQQTERIQHIKWSLIIYFKMCINSDTHPARRISCRWDRWQSRQGKSRWWTSPVLKSGAERNMKDMKSQQVKRWKPFQAKVTSEISFFSPPKQGFTPSKAAFLLFIQSNNLQISLYSLDYSWGFSRWLAGSCRWLQEKRPSAAPRG